MSTSGMFSTSRDIMMHVGEQDVKNLSISIENPNVLNIPNVLMISLDVLMVSPRCAEHPPTYSGYPPTSWYPPIH